MISRGVFIRSVNGKLDLAAQHRGLVLLVLFISFCPCTLQAQETPRTTMELPARFSIGLILGGGRVANHDGIGSPLIYSNYGLPAGAAIEFGSGAVRHRITVHALVSTLNSPTLTTDLSTGPTPRQAYFAFGSFEYEYLHSYRYNESELIHYALGSSVRGEGFARRYSYNGAPFSANGPFSASTGATSGEGTAALEAEGCAYMRLPGYGMFAATLQLPVVAILVRPTYGLSPTTNGTSLGGGLAYPGQMIAWQLGLEWTHDMSYHVTTSLRFRNEYYSYTRDGWRTATLTNSLEGVLAWRF